MQHQPNVETHFWLVFLIIAVKPKMQSVGVTGRCDAHLCQWSGCVSYSTHAVFFFLWSFLRQFVFNVFASLKKNIDRWSPICVLGTTGGPQRCCNQANKSSTKFWWQDGEKKQFKMFKKEMIYFSPSLWAVSVIIIDTRPRCSAGLLLTKKSIHGFEAESGLICSRHLGSNWLRLNSWWIQRGDVSALEAFNLDKMFKGWFI